MTHFTSKKDFLLPTLFGLIIGLFILLLNDGFGNKKEVSLPLNAGFADILEPVLPYTVSIFTNRHTVEKPSTIANDPFFSKFYNDDLQSQTSLGSGVILNANGTVITNAHVVKAADQVIVVTHTGEQASVTRIIIDPESDIAVLETNLQLTSSVPINTQQKERVGDIVFTVGNPFGIGQSVSMGVISATGRRQPTLTTLTDFIQTDAAINPGNSGGALVNAEGEVIGINSAIFSSTGGYQGIGFAIPIGQILTVANELIEKGRVTRGYLGIDVSELTPKERSSLLSFSNGLKINSVQENSPAEQADIRSEDILLSINQIPIKTRTEAARLITQLMPGKKTVLRIIRDGVEMEKTATISERK